MILKREFFFLRHGQTDHNRSPTREEQGDIPLNSTGREQVKRLAPLIAQLNIRTICFSPLQRAKETQEILIPLENSSCLEMNLLGGCTAQIWQEMIPLGPKAFISGSEKVRGFLNRAKQGVNEALAQEAPLLIIAHGSIHFAICCWMKITGYDWLTDNCQLTHFSINQTGRWQAKIL